MRVFGFKNCWIKERKDLCLTRRRVGKIEFRQYNIIKYILSHYNLKRGKNLCSARRRADKYEFMVSMLLLWHRANVTDKFIWNCVYIVQINLFKYTSLYFVALMRCFYHFYAIFIYCQHSLTRRPLRIPKLWITAELLNYLYKHFHKKKETFEIVAESANIKSNKNVTSKTNVSTKSNQIFVVFCKNKTWTFCCPSFPFVTKRSWHETNWK